MLQPVFRATTILAVRRDGKVAMGGDGQVTVGETVMKANAQKVRLLKGGKVVAGFAGAAADAFTLFERFEEKLERHPGNLSRAAVELAKDWRSDRVLRRLDALLAVADMQHGFILSGTGELIEPDDAEGTAERLRTAVATAGGVTASVGVATIALTDIGSAATAALTELVHAADAAMYDAKRAGGNQSRHRATTSTT